eukprot:SAG11_NODE_6295_length_1343_cov_1.284566_1_plen_67_part_10
MGPSKQTAAIDWPSSSGKIRATACVVGEYMPGHDVENEDAPFEMNVNGNQLVSQPSWSAEPTTSGGA